MAIDTDKIAQEAIDAIAEKIKNLNTLNIIVAGKTGVGKSTLINAVFRDKLAETGMGKPVTDHMRKISKKGIPLQYMTQKDLNLEETYNSRSNRRSWKPLVRDFPLRTLTRQFTAFGIALILHQTVWNRKKSSG